MAMPGPVAEPGYIAATRPAVPTMRFMHEAAGGSWGDIGCNQSGGRYGTGFSGLVGCEGKRNDHCREQQAKCLHQLVSKL